MHNNLDKLIEGLGGLQKDLKMIVDKANDPDILSTLNDQQKQIIKDAKKAQNLKGLTPQQMHDKLQGIINNQAFKTYGA